jgi:hypothetical protein
MRRRGIAACRVSGRRSGGGRGVQGRRGGRRNRAGSAVASRVAAIVKGCVSGGKRSRLPQPKRPSSRARASAQPRGERNFPAPVRAATSCSFSRRAAQGSDSVRACAARLCGAFYNARRAGGGGGKEGRAVIGGFRPGVRKYVAAYCRPVACGPMVVPSRPGFLAAIVQDEWCRAYGQAGESDERLARR